MKSKYVVNILILCVALVSLRPTLHAYTYFDSQKDSLDTTFTQKVVHIVDKIRIPIATKNGGNVCIAPTIGWNNYDKTLVGFSLFNDPQDSVYHYTITPLYGIGSKNLAGRLNMHYSIYPNKLLYVRIGAKAKRFSYLLFPEDLTWNKVLPSIELGIPLRHPYSFLSFSLQTHLITLEYILQGRKTAFYYANELGGYYSYARKKQHIDARFSLFQGSSFLFSTLESSYTYHYTRPQKEASIRIYFGGFLLENKPTSDITPPTSTIRMSGSVNHGIYWLQKDFLFDSDYIDRNGIDPFFDNQVQLVGGGFRSITNLGNVHSFLFTLNGYTDIPIPLPLQLFANVGGYRFQEKVEWMAETGFSITFFDDFLMFHFPLITTSNIKDNQVSVLGMDRYMKRISFTLHLEKLKMLK